MASKCYVGAMNFEPVELPAGYTQVESVKLTGTQWFDTGFKPNQNTRVVMECKADVLTSGGVFPFGVRTSTNAAAFAVAVTTTQVFANFNATYQFADYKNTYERMVIDFNKNVVTFKGSEEVTITLTNGNFTATSNLLIGNMNQAGSALDSSFTWQGDICPCKIYDNGTLVRDYVPCINSEGIAGLLDRVNNTFCGNAGTGTVIAGSVLKSVAKPVKKMYIGIPMINGLDENTVFLLHGNTLEDESTNGLTITNHGVSVSSTQSKFGGKSLYFNGASYLEVVSDSFLFANGDFTLDWWQYKENTGTFACINPWMNGDGYSQFLLQHSGGANLYSAYNDGDTWKALSGAPAFAQETGAWVHWAFVKKGTTVTTYRNGTKYWSGTVANNYGSNNGGLLLGCHASATNRDYFKGYVDEFRVSNIARWTTDFTPPARAYSADISEVARKVKKAYIGVNGIAQLCYMNSVNVSKLAISYTGNHTDQLVTMGDGKQYRLLTLTSTGTLKMDEAVNAEVWFCNGGENGAVATSSGGGKGGNGGNVRRKKTISTKTAVVTIGAGGSGATSVKTDSETISAETFRTPQGGGGGTGGDSGWGANGAGAAYSIMPFEDSYFTKKPCAGGGGGAAYITSKDGASNGGGGASNTTAGTSPTTSNTGGSGGATGGGTGGKSNSSANVAATSASYYGSGGGGGGLRGTAGSGGSGYQGICYIRISLDQPA